MPINFDIDFQQVLYNLIQLSLAFILALPVALNRESRAKGAGLRTFPLVALAACAFMLVAMSSFAGNEAQARVMYGIITGIGFIGGGAIFKNADSVHGTATAAGIWNTGAIGISVAYQHYEVALVLSAMNFFIFQFGDYLKKENQKKIVD
ncbi:hypothetical protein TDB9533_02528 [Thalassocella blandensis]|nr:hypothetical protein TDB9533_02528 [Thalassocella blandensis]